MTQILERDFAGQVADVVREVGHKATLEPSRIPKQRFWPDGLVSWVRAARLRPDILVEHGEEFVIIEVKTRPVLLGSVIQARRYADHFDATVILCVPDDAFPRIPGSA